MNKSKSRHYVNTGSYFYAPQRNLTPYSFPYNNTCAAPKKRAGICSLHSLFFRRIHADLAIIAALALKSDLACHLRKQRIILADTDIMTWMEMRAALTNENAASRHDRAGLLLNAQTLRLAVAAITRGADTFLCANNCKSKVNMKFTSVVLKYESLSD